MAVVGPSDTTLFPSRANMWDPLVNSINTALAEVKADALGSPTLPAGTDLDSITAASTYSVLSLNSHANRPEAVNGILRTYYVSATSGYQTWFTVGSSRNAWIRFRGSSGWSSWTRSDIGAAAPAALAAPPLTSGTDLNTITTDSLYLLQTPSTYTNGPGGNGILRTYYGSASNILQLFYTTGVANSVWRRWKGSSSWTAWTRIDAQSGIDQAKAYTDSVVQAAKSPGGSGTKLVPLALTVGGAQAASTLGAVGVRMPMQWGARVSRWRVHVRNINPRFGTNNAGAVSLTGLWFGPGDGSGSFTGATTQINSAISTPADGSEWVSGWISSPLEAGTRYLLAYGLNTTGTQSVVGGGWTTASPADAANSGAAKTARTALPLDVWIEAETAAATPVIAAWGDSLSSGVGATLPVFDSLVSQYCRGAGALPLHYTASGDSASNWASNLSAYKWTRWQGLAKPDVVIAAMGSNDVFNGDSLATIQGNWQACVDNILGGITTAVVATTITPRDGVTGAMEDTRRSLNTWLKGLPRGRDVFDLVPAVSADDEALTPALTSDGIHLTTAGYAAEVATITRTLVPASPRGTYPTSGRPDAAKVGTGGQCFDATLRKPLWSDGTAWRDATGSTV